MAGAEPACRFRARQGTASGGRWERWGLATITLRCKPSRKIFDASIAKVFGLSLATWSSRSIAAHADSGTRLEPSFLKEMVVAAKAFGIELPDRELACAPINSEIGKR